MPTTTAEPCSTPGCVRYSNVGCTKCCRKCDGRRHSSRCEARQPHLGPRPTSHAAATPLRLTPSWIPLWFGAHLRVRTFLLHAHETKEDLGSDRAFKFWLRAQKAAVEPDQGCNGELATVIDQLLAEEP